MDLVNVLIGGLGIAGCLYSYHRGWNAGYRSERQKYLPSHVDLFETEGSLKRERDEAGYDLLVSYADAVEEYNAVNPGANLRAYDNIEFFKQFIPALEKVIKKYPKMRVVNDTIIFDTPVGCFIIAENGDIKDLYLGLNSTFGLGYNYEYDYVYISRGLDY